MPDFSLPTAEQVAQAADVIEAQGLDVDGTVAKSWTCVYQDGYFEMTSDEVDPEDQASIDDEYEDGDPGEDFDDIYWYISIQFYVNSNGQPDANVGMNEVNNSSNWGGIGSHDTTHDLPVYLASMPVSPGDTVTIKEILDDMFNDGYDFPAVGELAGEDSDE